MSAATDSIATLQAALYLTEEYGLPVLACRPDKKPYTAHGLKDATTNLDQVAWWFEKWPDALIGVPTGSASKLVVVDVDPNGADWYREHQHELQCGRVHHTRRGHHLLYRAPGVEVRNSAGKIAAGIDVRGEGGYVIWWPAHGCEAIGDLFDITEPPAWLLGQMTQSAPKAQLNDDHDGGISAGGRNDYLSREAYRLRKQGVRGEDVLVALRGLNDARCHPPLDAAELERIATGKARVEPQVLPPESARPESLSVEEMLLRFVHVAKGPLIVDVTNTYRRLRPTEFAAANAHSRVVMDKNAIPATTIWAQSPDRMTADCLTFHPGEGQFFTERGLRHLNIWAEPDWPVTQATHAGRLLDHIGYLVPDAKQQSDFLDWLAHAAQEPAVRPHFHFLFVAAQEGTGRSWLVEVLRRVWGERHAGETDLHRLMDDSFNSILSGKVLMAVHEVKAPSDERYSHRDRLKSLLTDSVINVNEKHEPRWVERFCARFLMFSNRDDALPLSETDRRVYAVRCADAPRDQAYYSALYAKLNDQTFLAAVWHLLRDRDISHFNPGQRAPLNEMKVQMIAAGRTDEQQTAAEFLKACPHDVITATDLMALLVPPADGERPGERKSRMNAVTAVLRELGAQTYARKVKVHRLTTRAWILRNASAWSLATPFVIAKEAERCHEDIDASMNVLDAVMERWISHE